MLRSAGHLEVGLRRVFRSLWAFPLQGVEVVLMGALNSPKGKLLED